MPTCSHSSSKADKRQHDSDPAGTLASSLCTGGFLPKKRPIGILEFHNLTGKMIESPFALILRENLKAAALQIPSEMIANLDSIGEAPGQA
jgi:hypothetical protein